MLRILESTGHTCVISAALILALITRQLRREVSDDACQLSPRQPESGTSGTRAKVVTIMTSLIPDTHRAVYLYRYTSSPGRYLVERDDL